MHRRDFIKTILTGAGAISFLNPKNTLAGRNLFSSAYFGLSQFIETHPGAVFIMRTNVSYKTDTEAKMQAGYQLASEIFTLQDTPGTPLSHKIAIKPNLTCVLWTGGPAQTEEHIEQHEEP